jgi:hypothetical protein
MNTETDGARQQCVKIPIYCTNNQFLIRVTQLEYYLGLGDMLTKRRCP